MPDWRDIASPEAQQELEALLATALGTAHDELVQHGHFHPFALAVTSEGETQSLAMTDAQAAASPEAQEVHDACVAALAENRDMLRATAITSDVRDEEGAAAVRVELEHQQGANVTALLPYTLPETDGDTNEPAYGELLGEIEESQIWT